MGDMENNQKRSQYRNKDPFTRLMYRYPKSFYQHGNLLEKGMTEEKNTDDKNHPLFSLLENVDYNELMKNMDVLMKSSKSFKPLIQKFSPLISKFLDQKK